MLLDALREHKGRAVHVMELCSSLGFGPERRDQVLVALELLQEQGRLQQLPGLRFRIQKRNPRQFTPASARRTAKQRFRGQLRVHPRGFGFVDLDGSEPSIFIPAVALGPALHGDRVLVEVEQGQRGPEGRVVGVIERGRRHLAGVLRKRGSRAWVEADDHSRFQPIQIKGKLPPEARAGMEVVVEVTFYESASEPSEGKVVKVLGRAGQAEVEIAKIKLREAVEEDFPEPVLAEARAFGNRVTSQDKQDREDLRDVDLVTIDPATARDHDDALFVERTADNGYRVIVAIADVSHYVRPGTAIDEEALKRGTSLYLPDRSIPMLPPELSSNLASLVANRDRLTLAVEIQLSSSASVTSFRYI